MLNAAFMSEVGPLRWAARYAIRQFCKRVLRTDNTLTLPSGARMVLPRSSQSATEVFLTRGNIDWGSEVLFARHADPAGDLIDAGAHVGYYSCYLSPLVRRAYAFEPNPRNLAALKRNAAMAGNIDVVEMAVSSREGEAAFHLGSGTAVGSLEPGAGGRCISVPVTSIDRYLERHPGIRPRLIKTDIEGHDFEALLGMEETVARHQPLILTECEWSGALSALCSGWNYGIAAFVRSPGRRAPRFEAMHEGAAAGKRYKMLFLVPPRLKRELGEGRGQAEG